MLIIAPTIRHSGTHFLTDHLFRGWRRIHYDVKPDGDCWIVGHVSDDPFSNHWDEFPDAPIVTTLRSPVALVDTHSRWYSNFNPLLKDIRMLAESLEGREYFPLPLDSPKRHKCLARLNEALGLELTTDWPIMGHRDDLKEVLAHDNGAVRGIWSKYGWLFKDFYERA